MDLSMQALLYFVLGGFPLLRVMGVSVSSFLNKADLFVSRADFRAAFFWADTLFTSYCFQRLFDTRLQISSLDALR